MRLVLQAVSTTLRSRSVVAAAAAALVVAAAGTRSLLAGDDDPETAAASAEAKKVAQEALDRAVARGKAMWSSKERFGKPCSVCHEAADKPHLNLATIGNSYPHYSKRRKAVVTLQQKIQDMIQFNSRATTLDDKGTDIADLEAYVMSVKRK